jgi:hypothetical protein
VEPLAPALDLSGWNMGPIVALLSGFAFNALAGIQTGISLGTKKAAQSE